MPSWILFPHRYNFTGIGNWFQCFPVYPGLNFSSGSGSRSVSGSGSGFRLFQTPDLKALACWTFFASVKLECLVKRREVIVNTKPWQWHFNAVTQLTRGDFGNLFPCCHHSFFDLSPNKLANYGVRTTWSFTSRNAVGYIDILHGNILHTHWVK